ncbi:hypothetical protein Nepgr_028999 [Nepenthes gracilis]|uniref:Uncharacterized protein n=1 Tax=Nepenthes gracilis TaxID=150966 RepID=A0AAD3TE22_NEPGR|nr:hypothetical protein Nepgr_028999 [Nepenthes gracilis]
MAGSYSYKMFMCCTRKFKINWVQPPLDVREAFAVYADQASSMNAAQLRRFSSSFSGNQNALILMPTESFSSCCIGDAI